MEELKVKFILSLLAYLSEDYLYCLINLLVFLDFLSSLRIMEVFPENLFVVQYFKDRLQRYVAYRGE